MMGRPVLAVLAGCGALLQDVAGLTFAADGGVGESNKPKAKDSSPALPSKEDLDVDWPDFIAGHDLQWTVKDMPTSWKESAFVGNGRLGAMLWVEENRLRMEVGLSSLFDDRLPGDENAITPDDAVCNRARLPLGRFFLNMGGQPDMFKMRLRLYDAEIRGSVGNDKGNVTFKIFASTEPDVLVVRTVTKGADGIGDAKTWQDAEWTWEAADLTKMLQGCVKKRWSKNPSPQTTRQGNVSVWQQSHLNGRSHALAYGYATPTHPDEKVLLVSASSVLADAAALDRATAPVLKAQQANVDVLLRDHQNWWHDFYPRGAFLSVGERMLDQFYWVNMYKAASASRPGGALYDLQGPWPVEGTPWPDIHWDLNIQLTYMPFAAAGRLNLAESLWEFLEVNEANLINNVAPEFRNDSAAAPSLASGPDAKSSCNSKQWGGSIQRQGSTCVVAPPSITGNLLWTLQVLYGAYETTRDPKYASRLYPLLRRAVNFHMHLQAVKDEDGLVHLPASQSPEYGSPGRVKAQEDPNYDLALYRWGLTAILTMCGHHHTLCEGEPNKKKWAHSLENLADYPEHPEEGYTIYRGQRLEESHRHFSHMLMFYPLRLTNLTSKKDLGVAQRSLDHWVNKAGRLQGYSFVASSAMSTMLDRPESSIGNLSHLLHKYISRNTFYSEGGPTRPVAETPMFAATAIQELLLTHTSEQLRLFAGLPDRIPSASFYGMRAPGGVKISAERKKGFTTFVVVEGATEGAIEEGDNLTRPITIRPGFDPSGHIRFERPKGTSVALVEGQHTPDGRALVRVSGLARGARVHFWSSLSEDKPAFRVKRVV